MPLDKTLTIKKRRIDVYLPTLETKARWNAEAERRGLSVSDFVLQTVEMELQKEDLNGTEPQVLTESMEELAALRHDNDALRKRVEALEALNKRAETDLAQYRSEHIVGPEPIKRLDPRLIKILSETKGRDGRFRAVEAAELRKRLLIDPKSELELQALARQLEYLELHKVIKPSSKGWIWHAKGE